MKRRRYARRRRRYRKFKRFYRSYKRYRRYRRRKSYKSRLNIHRLGFIQPDRATIKLKCRFILNLSVPTTDSLWTQFGMNTWNPYGTEYVGGFGAIQNSYRGAMVLGSKITVRMIQLNANTSYQVVLIPFRTGGAFAATDTPVQVAENKNAIFRILGNSSSNNQMFLKNYRGCAKALGRTQKEYAEDFNSHAFAIPSSGSPINSPSIRPWWYLGLRQIPGGQGTSNVNVVITMTQYSKLFDETLFL